MVTLQITDVGGNTSSCTATVTIEDNVPPIAICQDLTVDLDAGGNGTDLCIQFLDIHEVIIELTFCLDIERYLVFALGLVCGAVIMLAFDNA